MGYFNVYNANKTKYEIQNIRVAFVDYSQLNTITVIDISGMMFL